jgi:hypothetical protein
MADPTGILQVIQGEGESVFGVYGVGGWSRQRRRHHRTNYGTLRVVTEKTQKTPLAELRTGRKRLAVLREEASK